MNLDRAFSPDGYSPLDDFVPSRDRLFAPPKMLAGREVVERGEPELHVHRNVREWWIELAIIEDGVPLSHGGWWYCVTTREIAARRPHYG